jgi:hypothetical protein
VKKQVGIVLLEFIRLRPGGSQNDAATYKVAQLKNTVEWSIGQDLTRQEVLSIINRKKPCPVEVIIKGLEFED